MARPVRPASGTSRRSFWPSEAGLAIGSHDARLPSWPGALGSSTPRPKIRVQSLRSHPALHALQQDAAPVACGVSPRPPFRVRRPAFHSAAAAILEPRLDLPAKDCLRHPPADGFLRLRTPPRPFHFHREPGAKARPTSKPPPNTLTRLDRRSPDTKDLGGGAVPQPPGPSLRSG